jgi:hypothetical protein
MVFCIKGINMVDLYNFRKYNFLFLLQRWGHKLDG